MGSSFRISLDIRDDITCTNFFFAQPTYSRDHLNALTVLDLIGHGLPVLCGRFTDARMQERAVEHFWNKVDRFCGWIVLVI